MVCHCLLLETDAGLVLVESGLGTAGVDRADAPSLTESRRCACQDL